MAIRDEQIHYSVTMLISVKPLFRGHVELSTTQWSCDVTSVFSDRVVLNGATTKLSCFLE